MSRASGCQEATGSTSQSQEASASRKARMAPKSLNFQALLPLLAHQAWCSGDHPRSQVFRVSTTRPSFGKVMVAGFHARNLAWIVRVNPRAACEDSICLSRNISFVQRTNGEKPCVSRASAVIDRADRQRHTQLVPAVQRVAIPFAHSVNDSEKERMREHSSAVNRKRAKRA